MTYIFDFLIVVAAILTSNYIHGFIFATFKADQYEDQLASKIAVAVVKKLEKEKKW